MVGGTFPKTLSLVAAGTLALGVTAGVASTASAGLRTGTATAGQPASPGGTCVLGPHGAIRHVIYLQFDNVHLRRDNPHVPSDLQQMPNLLKFLTGGGTLVTHEHTPLIAHTADDIVTSETGLYGSDQGDSIANEFNYYKPGGTTDTAGSFAYWADPIVDFDTKTSAPVGDHTPTMVGASGKMAPAPWVPYTRAGCDWGTVASANTELENQVPDVPLVYGPHSPQAREAENPKLANKAEADFMGLAIHCARGSGVCTKAPGARPDVLPAEPGGYHGFEALYGNKALAPVISPSGPVRNLNGTVIKDGSGDIGFPGYGGMTGPNALAYTLAMQTHGVPVTFTYLTDLHDSWRTGLPFGPGQAGYEQQLRKENAAFGTFFSRLAAHGITRANTLFVVTADEGDHFVGSRPSPAGCNGVKVPCNYSRIGEVNGDLTGLLHAKGVTTPFDVEADSAPGIYVHGQPARTVTGVRGLAQAAAGLRGDDLATGRKSVKLINFMADPVELRLLHMVTGDPRRTPSMVLFANQDFSLSSGKPNCGSACFSEPKGNDAWNHGDVGQQINTTWLGLAGPGVAHHGIDNALWSDHADIQPTMMALLRLRDDYTPDGRVLAEVISHAALPAGMRPHGSTLTRLGQAYTQLEAPVGQFSLATLAASTRALASKSAHDATYTKIEGQLQRLGSRRDGVAGQMRAMLMGAAFGGQPISVAAARHLITEGKAILKAAATLD